MEYPNLLSPMNIGPVTIKNRVVMTAMCVGLAHHDGAVSEDLAAYYEERAAGGTGLIITECTRVNETDAVSHSSMLSMSHDRYINPMHAVVKRVHAHGVRCMESFQENIMHGKPIECAVNPCTCPETKITSTAVKDGQKRPVVVVGAGPAGLTAARELAARDFKVTLLEQGGEPGGQLRLAAAPPLKDKIGWLVDNLTHQAIAMGAAIQYNTKATKELIDSYHPYAVFLATGGEAVAPRIPGSDSDAVTTVTPILTGERKYTGREIAVIGSGMTGLETAELLVEQGNIVTIIEMADNIAPGAYPVNSSDVIERLKKGGVRFLPGRKLERIGDGMLYISRKNGVHEEIRTAATVLAIGVRSSNTLEKECAGQFPRLYPIGDAIKPGRIGNAIRSAFELARGLW